MSLFAKSYDTAMYPLEKYWLHSIRKKLLGGLHGNILELGAGTGANFSYYPKNVFVRAVEPDSTMRNKAEERAESASSRIEVVEGSGEKLFCPDNAYDFAVSTLVLCSVDDQLKTAKELYRVLKPGGKLILFEHVRVKNPFWAKVQDVIAPAWAKICDNCQLNRNTEAIIREVFGEVKLEYYFYGIFVEIAASKK